MARRTIVVDDIDGSEDAREVTFALDGETWRIDLSAENRQLLREALGEYIESAVKVGGTRVSRSSSAAATFDLADVREWARANGYEVSDRGRIPKRILEAYEEA